MDEDGQNFHCQMNLVFLIVGIALSNNCVRIIH